MPIDFDRTLKCGFCGEPCDRDNIKTQRRVCFECEDRPRDDLVMWDEWSEESWSQRRPRCNQRTSVYGACAEAILAAPILVATSMYSTTGLYRALFWVDSWHEHSADSPQCIGNHRTHEAAVNCAKRYARHAGLRCFTLEQHDPQAPA